jgi:hypothetical protein
MMKLGISELHDAAYPINLGRGLARLCESSVIIEWSHGRVVREMRGLDVGDSVHVHNN